MSTWERADRGVKNATWYAGFSLASLAITGFGLVTHAEAIPALKFNEVAFDPLSVTEVGAIATVASVVFCIGASVLFLRDYKGAKNADDAAHAARVRRH